VITAVSTTGESRRSVVPHAILLAGLLFQTGLACWFFAFRDPEINRLVPDDTFYYLKIAANIAEGRGSVFSPGEPTNGYHPLWMAVLVTAHAILRPGRDAFLLVAMLLGAVLSSAAAWIFRLVLLRHGFGEPRSTAGMAFFLFSPWSVLLVLSGLETALFYLLFFLYLLVFRTSSGGEPRMLSMVVLGLCAGMLDLARTDSIIITGIGYAIILFGRRPISRKLAGLAAALAANLAVLGPWLLWNLSRFGSVSQDSAWAISYWRWHTLPSPLTLRYHALAAGRLLHKAAVFFAQPFVYRPAEYGFPAAVDILFALASLALVTAVLLRRRRPGGTPMPPMLWIPALTILVFYAFVRIHSQVWHLSTLVPAAITALLVLSPDKPGWKPAAVLCAVLLPACLYALGNGYYYPQQQRNMIRFATEYRADSDSVLLLGNGDCGYLGYFSRHTVVNLDGIVNGTALEYIRRGRLQEYIDLMEFDEVYLGSMEPDRVAFYNRNMPVPDP
jgi:hypothetical protein